MTWRRGTSVVGALALPSLVLASGCRDPVRDDLATSLGGEAPGVKAGPLHRPGQPCMACHEGDGPGEIVFSIAGTAYQSSEATVPLANAIVNVIDSTGKRALTGTNCAGNFWFVPEDFTPVYPVWTSIEFGGVKSPMNSPIFRDGSCATCHTDPPAPESAGHVFFAPQPLPFPDDGCP